MAYPQPPKNKSAVRRAGNLVAEGSADFADIQLIDDWRAAHGYVINTFQAWIRGHIQKRIEIVEFAQRLKRRNTVIDKLIRKLPDGRPLISDVTAMNDFAGCRIIFEDLESLSNFRSYMHSPDVMKNVEHELRHDKEKYDYINMPKSTGYRGIHDVYKHFPRGTRRGEAKKPWDGLLVEIQYRTRVQHAWATAVEISDLIDGERTKFELDQSKRGEFFALASEILARSVEGIHRTYQDLTTKELVERLEDIEGEKGILRRLELLRQFEVEGKLKRHNVLSIHNDLSDELELRVESFKSAAPAIERATELEETGDSINAVYVRADNPAQLRSAYRNYFYDPVDFVEAIRAVTE